MEINFNQLNYKPTILVVDDEKINIDYIVKNFDDKFNFKATTNSKVVFDILQKSKIDLILLDIQMPEINGFEIAKQLQENEEFRNIPFIFLTSQTDTQSVIEGFDLGAIDYITKPFHLKELKARIYTHSKNFILQQKVKEQQREILIQSKFSAMGEMTSMLAHQWRQPLNVIALLIQELDLDRQMNIFSEEEYTEKKNKLLKTVVELSSTIDNFGKYFQKNGTSENSNIIECLDDSINMFKEILDDKKINLTTLTNGNKEDFNIKIVPKDLVQIFINIIQNSIDALDNLRENIDKFIKIEINKLDDFIEIHIFDNGPGIEREIIDTVFEPYVSTKDNLNGPGLGLFTTKMLIENYLNGTISASNTEYGAYFKIKIKK